MPARKRYAKLLELNPTYLDVAARLERLEMPLAASSPALASASPEGLAIGQRLANRYDILGELGSGASAGSTRPGTSISARWAQQQPRLTHQGARDHHPLQHPARQLVRVLAQVARGVREPHGGRAGRAPVRRAARTSLRRAYRSDSMR